MMRAEKVAGDLVEAHETVAGPASPMPTLASLVRRLERKAAAAGGLLDPAVAALDRALKGLEEAEAALEAAMATAAFDPKELERIEERLFALRAAGRKHKVPVAALPAVLEANGGRSRRTGVRRGASGRLESRRPPPPAPPTTPTPRPCRRNAAPPPGVWRRPSPRNCLR